MTHTEHCHDGGVGGGPVYTGMAMILVGEGVTAVVMIIVMREREGVL